MIPIVCYGDVEQRWRPVRALQTAIERQVNAVRSTDLGTPMVSISQITSPLGVIERLDVPVIMLTRRLRRSPRVYSVEKRLDSFSTVSIGLQRRQGQKDTRFIRAFGEETPKFLVRL